MKLTHSRYAASIALVAIGFSFPALAQEAGPVLKAPPPSAPVDAPSPYQLRLLYTGEIWNNAQGGIRTGWDYMQNIDAQLSINTERAYGWTGGRFFIEGFYGNGNSFNENFIGSVQDASVIDLGRNSLARLYQVYYDQNIAATNTDIRLGVMDIETEFGITRAMDPFFNGGFAWTTTLDHSGEQLNGPSTFPNTSLGIRVRQKINDQLSIQGAVLNGMADLPDSSRAIDISMNRENGALAIAEVDYTPIARTKIYGGYWTYTGLFDTQNEFNDDGSIRQVWGSSGAYVGAGTRLYTINGPRGLDAFVNFGVADDRTNVVDRSVNVGLTWTGLLDSRPADKMSFGVSTAHAGSPFQQAQIVEIGSVHRYETVFEATYRARVNEWLTVQPDVQYIVNPGFDPTLKNAFMFGVHFEVGKHFGL
jgi:porin